MKPDIYMLHLFFSIYVTLFIFDNCQSSIFSDFVTTASAQLGKTAVTLTHYLSVH